MGQHGGCGGPDPRDTATSTADDGVVTGVQPLHPGDGPVWRRRRARGGLAGRVAVLQPQPRRLAPAGPALPRHQHGAVRTARAARRSGHRPLPVGAPLARRDPVRRPRGLRSGVGVHAARPGPVLLRPLAADLRKGLRRRASGARTRARRRGRPARVRQLPTGPPQRDRRRRRRGDRRRRARPDPPSDDHPRPRLRVVRRRRRREPAAAEHHPQRRGDPGRRVRGAARPDHRRHVVGVHGDPRRRRVLRVRVGVRPAPHE